MHKNKYLYLFITILFFILVINYYQEPGSMKTEMENLEMENLEMENQLNEYKRIIDSQTIEHINAIEKLNDDLEFWKSLLFDARTIIFNPEEHMKGSVGPLESNNILIEYLDTNEYLILFSDLVNSSYRMITFQKEKPHIVQVSLHVDSESLISWNIENGIITGISVREDIEKIRLVYENEEILLDLQSAVDKEEKIIKYWYLDINLDENIIIENLKIEIEGLNEKNEIVWRDSYN